MGDIFNSPYSLNAPTYVDFGQQTPGVSRIDEFFEVFHPEHEPGHHLEAEQEDEQKKNKDFQISGAQAAPATNDSGDAVIPSVVKNIEKLLLSETDDDDDDGKIEAIVLQNEIVDNNDEEEFKVHKANLIENVPVKKRPAVLTSQARRRISNIHNHGASRPVKKYISTAEAIRKFQEATPERFRSSKARVNKHQVMSQAEREEQELQEIRKNKPKANPVPTRILAAAKPLKEVAKKPVTVPKPFRLTRTVKQAAAATAPAAVTTHIKTTTKTKLKTKCVPVINVVNNEVVVTKQQVLNFGIPAHTKEKEMNKKNIRPLSSDFDARNKQFLDKKQEKIKKLQIEEAEKIKVEFHARPVPQNIKKPLKKISEAVNNKSADSHHHYTKPAPFSFQERDNKLLANKKQELRKKFEEEEIKNKRVFHANPVPKFKPVTLSGHSRENLNKTDRVLGAKAKSFDVIDNKKNIARGQPELSVSSDNLKKVKSAKALPDKENRAANNQRVMPVLKPRLKSFDLHTRQKIGIDEMHKKRELGEQAQANELRKKAEIKARPMPAFQPLVVKRSSKPLTVPASPAWARRLQQKKTN